MHVRDKVLTLIGSWHEAFGGSGGRYPQYFMAYEELRVNILISLVRICDVCDLYFSGKGC